jgi:hypothetical protein
MADLNPYVGPRTFGQAEADRFFGREQEAAELRALVVSERLVLFYAQSGAGKSSLINARLIPRLQQGGFAVLPVGRVSGQPPGDGGPIQNIFVFNLISSLNQGTTPLQRFSQMSFDHFLAHLTSTDGQYYTYDDSPLPAESPTSSIEPRHVLIIDQFEEIITAHPDRWPEREEFFRQLDQAMAEDSLLHVVLTLREDYLAALEPYAPLLRDKMRARYYMQRMGYEAALEAIKEPAAQFGRPFAPNIAETLADNLRQARGYAQALTWPGQFVEPVQLQVVCFQLWESLKDRSWVEITEADLPPGYVDQALTIFYETTIKEVAQATDLSEETLRQWFEAELITEADTRSTVFRGSQTTGNLPNPVVDLLIARFLLRSESRAGGIWYELVHDRFIEPILKANEVWQVVPLILSFEITPTLINPGNSVELTWEVINAEAVYLDPIDQEAHPLQGSRRHSPDSNTVYTLRAVKANSRLPEVSKSEKVLVRSRYREAGEGIRANQDAYLVDSILAGRFIPLISGAVNYRQIFGITEEEVASEWANHWPHDIKYPFHDKYYLADVARYLSIQIGDRGAKREFLEFLKHLLLWTAEEQGRSIDANLRWRLSLSDLAAQLNYPTHDRPDQDLLWTLARLPLPIYLTTSYHAFLEQALRAQLREPQTQVCFWNGQPDDVDSVLLSDPNFRPNVDRPVVYHLFGFEQYPDTLVLSEDDYIDFLVELSHKPDLIPSYLRTALDESTLLLLGFQVEAWDFRTLHRGILNPWSSTRQRDSVITLDPSGEIERSGDFIRRELTRYYEGYLANLRLQVHWGTPQECGRWLWEAWQNATAR